MTQRIASSTQQNSTQETQPTPEKKLKRVLVAFSEQKTGMHPCQLACKGNKKMGFLLNFFLQQAAWEMQNKHLPEGCATVDLHLSHAKILASKSIHFSEPTLNGYLKKFNEWGFVLSQPYSRTFTVQAGPIKAAMFTEEKFKSSSSDALTFPEDMSEKVKVLEEKVKELEDNVKELKLFLKELKLSESREPASEEAAKGEKSLSSIDISNKEILDKEREERVYSVSADAENATPSPAFSSSGFSPWDDQDEEDQQETLQTLQAAGIVPAQPDQPQEAATHPIATETPSPDAVSMAGSEPVSQAETPSQPSGVPAQTGAQDGRGKKSAKQAKTPTQSTLDLPAGPPIMPPETAAWPSAETAVQIVEAKLGKRYREAARIKEINAAKRMFKDDPALTREQFVSAYDERNDAWWNERNGLLHFHHMVEKDRVHGMLDRIEARQKKATPGAPPASSSPGTALPTGRNAILLSEERLKRNRERLHAEAEASRQRNAEREARRAAAL